MPMQNCVVNIDMHMHDNITVYLIVIHSKILAKSIKLRLGFKSLLGWDFSEFRSFNLVKIVTPCCISFGFLAGPLGDSEIEN